MTVQQNSTNENSPATVKAKPVERQLDWRHEQYIAYVAMGGLIPDPDGNNLAVKMTTTQLAARLGVERTTMFYWRKSIPGFWDLVAEKRKELGSKDRLSQVWNGIFMKASAGNAEAAKLYLSNFDPDFRMPMQKVEHEVGDSLAEAISAARNRRNIIEAEVIDGSTDDQA